MVEQVGALTVELFNYPTIQLSNYPTIQPAAIFFFAASFQKAFSGFTHFRRLRRGGSETGMNKTYVIQWKSKVNGRAGRETKLFSKDDAERLVEELNREYPQIVHEPIETQPHAHTEPQEQTAPEANPLFLIA